MAKLVVTPLGVGGWVSNPLLGTVSFIVEAGPLTMLLEAGEGVYAAMRRCGFDVADIDYVLITHKHGDHALGLPTLAVHARRLGRRLKVLAPTDLDVELLLRAVGIPDHIAALELHPIDPVPEPALVLEEQGVKVYAAAADHSVPSLAYRIEAGGAALAYTGDTRPTPSIVKLARGCKLLIHEATFDDQHRELALADGHSTPSQAAETAREAGAQYLMPVHYRLEPPALETPGLKVVFPLPCTPLDICRLP
jgi:ribonuclease Z